MNRALLSSLAAVLIPVAGCGIGGMDTGVVRSAAPGRVSGAISYQGGYVGPLQVALFRSFPPRGTPVARVDISEPTFPQPFELEDLMPGTYFLLAIVDADPTDGDRYHPHDDPGGAFGSYNKPMSITLTTTSGARDVDIELVDPSATSPWASRSYR